MEKVDTQRLQEMSTTHHKVAFPEEKNGTVFLNTSILFKRSQPGNDTAAASQTSQSIPESKPADTEKPASSEPKTSTAASISNKIGKTKLPASTQDPAKHKRISTST